MKLSTLVPAVIAFASTAAVATAAQAAPDLAVSISAPAGVFVGDPAQYTVRVTNVGNQTSGAGTLVIRLPETHTSPTVHVMGTLGALPNGCTRSGTRLNCTLGQIRRNAFSEFRVNLALPQSAAPLNLIATAAMNAGSENSQANNSVTRTLALEFIDTDIAGPVNVQNRHCTGQGLTAFFECTLYPSAISGHDVIFEAGGSISIPDAPEYTGQWTRPVNEPDRLVFQYFDETGAMVVDFNGYGVGDNCFEGLTVFPGSVYVSPYEVCLQ